ncbi:aminoacyl-tRNA hydrolase, partial [Patescibacteria group bacterium]|nr:aminoacyl-tRNA hydrolase [Patescibacteria group bacterium]
NMETSKKNISNGVKLIFGLGNPGKKYEKTRHNAGFIAIDALGRNFSAKGGSAAGGQFSIFNFQSKFNAEISEGMVNGEKILLAKPQTFMNSSGQAVKAVVDYYGAPHTRAKHIPILFGGAESAEAEKKAHPLKDLQTRVSAKADKIEPKDIIVIHDDLDIPLGEYKIARDRGSAGHKGVQSVIDALGTKDFIRIRIGIKPLDKLGATQIPTKEFVLENFTKEEKKIIDEVIEKICGEIESRVLGIKK